MTDNHIDNPHSKILWPSFLGNWQRYQRRALAECFDTSQKTLHIATWIGRALHAKLARKPLPQKPVYCLYDPITPTHEIALRQLDTMERSFCGFISAIGRYPKDWEVEVGVVEGIKGRIDVVLEDPVLPGLVLADIKTGQRIPSGAWLQLGAYMDIRQAEQPSLALVGGEEKVVSKLSVIHLPRTSIFKEQGCEIYDRDPGEVRELALAAISSAMAYLKGKLPATVNPGIHCQSCALNETCAARV